MKNKINKILQKFTRIMFNLFFLFIVLIGIFTMGLATIPSAFIVKHLLIQEFSSEYIQVIVWAMSIPVLYFTYGVSIIFISPFINKILFVNRFVRNFSGNMYSVEAMFWYLHNGLTYIPRYTFLDLISPSPLLNLFYKMMGMKIGKNTIINTTNISDPCRIEIGDNCTIGGSAYLLAHYAQRGQLVIAPLIIKNGVTIGLKAKIFGNNIIEDKCFIYPNVVLPPKTNPDKGTKIK